MKLSSNIHLSYCTNIHPAETWGETLTVLKNHTLAVRDKVIAARGLEHETPFAIGLRLSEKAASELLQGNQLDDFIAWLEKENTYVYTINGFPYGAFHGTRVKEKVYQPDWTTPERLSYTLELFNIIAELAPADAGGSVSTLPGSFKEFDADEDQMFENLYACAMHIELLSEQYEKDLHLGLEPEPLGHFENTQETIEFFIRFHQWAENNELRADILAKRIGVNYDTCHFALEYEDCHDSLTRFENAAIRISKIHLSNALSIDPHDSEAQKAIHQFDEPTYLHQVLIKKSDGSILRFRDLPEYFEAVEASDYPHDGATEARIHFHIPLYDDPEAPLGSTRDHAEAAIAYLKEKPETCPHLEMETYTWGVLPNGLQIPIEDQLTKEYLWTLQISSE
jgi:sugar phosphate isomerase/epimerase